MHIFSQMILPENYVKKLCSMTDLGLSMADGFETTFLLKIDNDDDLEQWIEDFQKKSLARFRIGKLERPCSRIRFKVIMCNASHHYFTL